MPTPRAFPSLSLLTCGLFLAGLASSGCEHGGPEPVEPPPQTHAAVCPGAAALDEVWSPARRESLSVALSELPGEWPAQLLETVDARLSERAGAWREAYSNACEANDEGAQRCLDAELGQLDAALALSAEQPNWARHSWSAIDGALRDPTICAARAAAFSDPPLAAPLARSWSTLSLERDSLEGLARIEALHARLESSKFGASVHDTPRYAFELALSEVIVANVVHLMDEGNPKAFEDALARAESLATQLGPRAQFTLLFVRAGLFSDPETKLEAAKAAVASARALEDPWRLLPALHTLGKLHSSQGDDPLASEALAEAIALSTRIAGAQSPRVAEIQLSLAKALTSMGKIEAAYDLLSQARDSFILELGPDHPLTLGSVEGIGELFMAAGQPGDAQYAYLDLLDVYDNLYGAKHWRVATIKLELGDSLSAMEQFEGARTMYVEALTPIVQEFGPDHRDAIRASIHLGLAELALEHLDEAEAHCQRGVNLVKALSKDDPLVLEVAQCVEELGKARKRGKRRRKG